MGDLTTHFSRSEFACKCGCGADNVDRPFLWRLEQARVGAKVAFKVVSGCRCPVWNEAEGGKPESDHLTTEDIPCEGVDVEALSGRPRFKIVEAALAVGFIRIGIAKTFIHLGTARRNPLGVLWVY